MKQFSLLLLFFLATKTGTAQTDKEKVETACMNYIAGFYEGDTIKLMESLKPALYKFGFYKDKQTGQYRPDGQMTYRQALDYASRIMQTKKFAKKDAPKKVEVLDLGNSIAAAKVTAWWGTDYLLLSKQQHKWMIEQVLWEGPLE